MKSIGKRARRAIVGMCMGLAVGLLASCGGGTEQVTPFAPVRMFAFGDEMSVLTKELPQGRKYTVNAVQSDGVTIDCAVSTAWLWTQSLAALYQFAFEECNPLNQKVNAFSYAAPGAKAADFLVQIEAARAARGPFTSTDLMTVLIGANDVIDLFENVYLKDPTSATATTLTNELSTRGAQLGVAITALTANNGPRVILSTIPMLNLTPYALKQAAARPGANVQNVLQAFSNAFNTAMRAGYNDIPAIPNDGRRWGLVELDAMTQAGVDSPGSYGLTNTTQAACAVALPDCYNVSADLVSGANASSWLWASDLWIGWRAHNYLGNYARGRVQGNPF